MSESDAIATKTTATSPTSTDLLTLPGEIVATIVSFLAPKDIGSLARTCSQSAEICRGDFLWRQVAQRLFPSEAVAPPLQNSLSRPSFRDYFALKLRIHGPSPRPFFFARASYAGDPPCQRYKHTATKVGQSIFVIGGQVSHNHRFASIHEFDTRTGCWRRVVPTRGTVPAFARHTAVAIGTKIVMFGGFDGDATYYGVQVFDTETHEWRSVTPSSGRSPQCRTNHSAVAIGETMYIWGGITTERLVDIGDMWAFDTRSMTWEEIRQRGAVPPARCGHSMFALGNKIVLFGGGARESWEEKFSDLRIFDTATHVWSVQKTSGSVDPLIFSLSCRIGPFLMFFAGIGPEKIETVQRKLFFLDTQTFHWEEIQYSSVHDNDSAPFPVSKSMGTANLVGSTVYFFGGSDNFVRPLFSFETLKLPFPPKVLQMYSRDN